MCPTETTLLSGPGSVLAILVPGSITAEAEITDRKSIDRTDQQGAERNSPSEPFATVGERHQPFGVVRESNPQQPSSTLGALAIELTTRVKYEKGSEPEPASTR